jgi:hypothetical protein
LTDVQSLGRPGNIHVLDYTFKNPQLMECHNPSDDCLTQS